MVYASRYILLVLCVLSILVLSSGCDNHFKQNQDSSLVAFPDKEKFLLASLNHRFDNPDVHCELGRLYTQEGLWDKAQYHFNVALGLNPSHRKSQAGQIKMLIERGYIYEADSLVDRYKQQLWISTVELLELAKALAGEDLDEIALSYYNHALKMRPNSSYANKEIGFFYLRRDRIEQAKQYLKRSFELDPNQQDVAVELGRLGIVIEVPGKKDNVKVVPIP